MKKFKVVKDTPFHTIGTVLEESDMSFYNYVKMSEGEAASVINFWSFFEEVKEPRFTMENLPERFIFEGVIYDYNALIYKITADSYVWYQSKQKSTISKSELLNKVNNSVSKVYIITESEN